MLEGVWTISWRWMWFASVGCALSRVLAVARYYEIQKKVCLRGARFLLLALLLHSSCSEVPIGTGTYVLMQLFTAIIIENFSSTTRSSIISKEQLDDFVDVWVELDPGGEECRMAI